MNDRHLFWQLPIALLVTSPLWYGAAARFLTLEQKTSSTIPVHQDSNFSMEDVVFIQAKQGVNELLLRAKRLRGAGDNNGFDLDEADAKRLGTRPTHITGGSAHYDPEHEILTVLDDVVIKTNDLEVRTPAMRYLSKFETVKSAADVEMKGQGFFISGTSFMYNLASGNLRIGKRVNFLYTPPSGQAAQASSE
ncbi:MAG: LPS export ABC transporter periplasmic protein LptC [Desulfobulbaceae bacterium]|nr:LPS export ABC transporter periplasmic protein LptC [Desulfobulbaceae bacterium]